MFRTYITYTCTTHMHFHFFTSSIFTKPYENYVIWNVYKLALHYIYIRYNQFLLVKILRWIYFRMQSLYQYSIYWQAFVKVLICSHASLLKFSEIKLIDLINSIFLYSRCNWSIAFIFNIDCKSFKIGTVNYQWFSCICICVAYLLLSNRIEF